MTDQQHTTTVEPSTGDGREMWVARCADPCPWKSVRCVSEAQAREIGRNHEADQWRWIPDTGYRR